MAYLLDTNVFIQAKDLHYGFDFCPAFWEWLIKQNNSGRVYSIEKVSDELSAIEDELADWSEERGYGFFLRPDSTLFAALTTVSEWVMGQMYDQSAVNTFFQKADYYLVAQALSGKHVVVTHEIPSNSPRKVKIPDACIGLGIKCMTPFDMLRTERARFVLRH